MEQSGGDGRAGGPRPADARSPASGGTGQQLRRALSPSLRCSAASLVSWESEMKHCSSGRGKLFCSAPPCGLDAVSGGGGWGTPGRTGAFPVSVGPAAGAEAASGLKSYPCHDRLHASGRILTPPCTPVGPSVTEVSGIRWRPVPDTLPLLSLSEPMADAAHQSGHAFLKGSDAPSDPFSTLSPGELLLMIQS